jgi:hypothetical protein
MRTERFRGNAGERLKAGNRRARGLWVIGISRSLGQPEHGLALWFWMSF